MTNLKAIATRLGVYIGITTLFIGLTYYEKIKAEKNERRTRKARAARRKAAGGSKTTTKTKATSKSKGNGLITFKQWSVIKKKDPSKRSVKEKKEYFKYNMEKGRKKANK